MFLQSSEYIIPPATAQTRVTNKISFLNQKICTIVPFVVSVIDVTYKLPQQF